MACDTHAICFMEGSAMKSGAFHALCISRTAPAAEQLDEAAVDGRAEFSPAPPGPSPPGLGCMQMTAPDRCACQLKHSICAPSFTSDICCAEDACCVTIHHGCLL